MCGHLGWLEDDGVTSCNCANDRSDLDGDWIVPSSQNQDGSLWFTSDVWVVETPSETAVYFFDFGPLFEVVDGFDCLCDGEHHFGKHGLELGSTEILLESLTPRIFVVGEKIGELLELVLAILEIARLAGQEGFTELLVDLWCGWARREMVIMALSGSPLKCRRLCSPVE